MRVKSPVLLALPLLLAAVACSRSNLRGGAPQEQGGGGAGGGATSTAGSAGTAGTAGTAGSAGGAGTTTMTTSTTTVEPGSCGDGVVDPGEQCDDGNGSFQDACLPGCVLAFCGDGFVHVGFEQCDDANADPGDDCALCAVAFCGDGFVHVGFEQCDDGNQIDGDGCSSKCALAGAACGNGVVETGEACDLGPANADQPALLLSWQMTSSSVVPVVSPADASLFYNYFSMSGHTGFEAVDTSILFLYVNQTTKALSLFVEHGVDFTTTGINQMSAHVDMDITGLPQSSVVALSDDTPGEFFKSSATSARGSWDFQQNSDGGVISGLPFPGSWTITITPKLAPPITTWRFQSGGSMPAPITLGGASAVLRAFDAPSACRTSCTVPACGDGILDGGEVCDDGNTTGGDGCSADCKGF